MAKIAAALFLVAALAAAASAETYTLQPTDGDARGFTVTADRAPVMTPAGVAAFPPGTRLTVSAPGRSSFQVFLVGPSSLDDHSARRHWSGAVTRPGGYKLQYGRFLGQSMAQVDFVVADLSEQGP